MKKFFFLPLLLLLFSVSSCKKTGCGKKEVTGIIKDYTGKLDGCTFMIELGDGQKLEVRSLPAGITLVDDKRVAIRYTINQNVVSNCMAGAIADITSLRYL